MLQTVSCFWCVWKYVRKNTFNLMMPTRMSMGKSNSAQAILGTVDRVREEIYMGYLVK
jgi:hypothetical protein